MGQAQPINRLALIVEDDELQRLMLNDLLEDKDLRVIQCESGEAAAVVLREYGNDLSILVTDVNLAGNMTGIDLAIFAKDHFPDLKVIVVSGYDQDVPSDVCFLRKPWRPLELIRQVID